MTTTENKRRTTASYYLSFIMLGMILAILGPTLPYLAEQTGSQLSQISFLFTARALGGFSGALLSGRLYDRRAGHPMLALTLLAFVAVLALIPLVPMLWLLSLVVFVMGLAEGGLDVGVNTLLMWIHGRDVGPYMNGLHFFFGLGAFLSPLIIAQLLAAHGRAQWGFWILAILILPSLLWIWRLPSPEAPPAREEGDATVRGNLFIVLLMAFLLTLYVGAEMSFGGWIFSYALALELATETTAAYLTSLFWGTFTVGRLLAIPLARRLRPRTVLLSDLLLACAGLTLILVGGQAQIAVWTGTFLVGLGLASVFPTVLTLAERRMTITGRVTSAFFVGANVGAMTLPWLIGQLFTAIGPQTTMMAILVDLLLALLILAVLLRQTTAPDTG